MARNKSFEPEERLSKARDLFWQKGYQATSMQDLVDTTGLNRGSIYDTYGDKHQLFLMCLKSYADDLLLDHQTVAETTKSPLKAIEKIIKRAVNRVIEEGKSCMIVRTAFELAAVDNAVHVILKEHTTDTIALLVDLIRKAQKAGEISGKREPAVLASFIHANFAALDQSYLIYKDAELIKQQADFLIKSVRK